MGIWTFQLTVMFTANGPGTPADPGSEADGTMLRTCERAVAIGLPAVVFTEHLDFEGWRIEPQDATDTIQHLISPKGVLEVPSLDVAGYLDCIDPAEACSRPCGF